MTETEAKENFQRILDDTTNNLKAEAGRMVLAEVSQRRQQMYQDMDELCRAVFNDVLEIVAAYASANCGDITGWMSTRI